MRAWVVRLVLLVAIAGCATPAPGDSTEADSNEVPVLVPSASADPRSEPQEAVPQVARVVLLADQGLTLELGIGWGQLGLVVPKSATVRISHPEFEEFSSFSDLAGDIYVPGTFTIIRLEAQESEPSEFWWLGRDSSFSGPLGSDAEAREGSLKASNYDGEPLSLTVGTNYGGYVLEINGGGERRSWPLGDHSGMGILLPEPEVSFGEDLGALRTAYQREWRVDFPALASAALYAQSWASDFSDDLPGGTRWGIESIAFGVQAQGEEPWSAGPGPAGGFGSYFGTGSAMTATVRDPTDMYAVLRYDQTDAGTTRTSDGLAVVVLPLLPP